MALKKVTSGVMGLDPLIEGGFPAKRSYLISGEPGTGKTIFGLQFVMKGLLEGDKAVYVAVDEKPGDLLEEAGSLGWNLQPFIDKKHLMILDAAPYFSARTGQAREREVDVQKIVTDLSNYAKRMEASRLVIDPVGPLITSGDSVYRVQENARTLVHALQSTVETTNLLTAYSIPDADGGVKTGVEEFLVAGAIVLRCMRAGNRFIRTMMVRKLRGTSFELMEHEFSIMKGKGLVLYPQLEPMR